MADRLTQAQAIARAGCSWWAFQKYRDLLGIRGERDVLGDWRVRYYDPADADLIASMVKQPGQRGPDRGPRKRRVRTYR